MGMNNHFLFIILLSRFILILLCTCFSPPGFLFGFDSNLIKLVLQYQLLVYNRRSKNTEWLHHQKARVLWQKGQIQLTKGLLKGFSSIAKKGNIGIKTYLKNTYWITGNFSNEFIVAKGNTEENVNSVPLYF